MGSFGRTLKWLLLLPVLVVILLLAVANDQTVTLHFNPFDPADPVLSVDLALYQLGFIIFVIGALVGALVSWSGQRGYRRAARRRADDAAVRRERFTAPPTPRPTSGAAAFLPRPERS